MLLGGDREGVDIGESTGRDCGALECGPPVHGVDFGACGMGRATLPQQRAGFGIANNNIARLRG